MRRAPGLVKLTAIMYGEPGELLVRALLQVAQHPGLVRVPGRPLRALVLRADAIETSRTSTAVADDTCRAVRRTSSLPWQR